VEEVCSLRETYSFLNRLKEALEAERPPEEGRPPAARLLPRGCTGPGPSPRRVSSCAGGGRGGRLRQRLRAGGSCHPPSATQLLGAERRPRHPASFRQAAVVRASPRSLTSSHRAVTSRAGLSPTAPSRVARQPPRLATRWRHRHLRRTPTLRAYSKRHGKTPPLLRTTASIGPTLSQSARQARAHCHARLLSNGRRRRFCSAPEGNWGRGERVPPSRLPAERGAAAAAGWPRRLSVRAASTNSIAMGKSGGCVFVVPGRGGQPRCRAAQVSLGAALRRLPLPRGGRGDAGQGGPGGSCFPGRSAAAGSNPPPAASPAPPT